ncbi:hypothetical protein CCR97_08225 [Rhodoplanes elegans]|uniref:Methyltransferase type 11 domain-containing protein n=1 Tax=Rhodoplanes elegans TaxID=29408 RepID=A0A327KST4_9BRAD|nr:class I SAM-dependent methyltransferase [Rhodoplanes elegans]MBK5958105.1 hypothetical protein [Rhodoplanes elegans]MBK5958197.1 hypothetical protein [Rhodoplanes elegans]RAI41980.1 hypothetical protein CH338_01365 [Rhodoplanes elegans]
MSLDNGERQVAPTIDGIRADHVARYRWAAERLPAGSRVLDAGCGIGYGARILAEAGHKVVALDRSAEALAYGREHYDHEGIAWRTGDLSDLGVLPMLDAVVCFEAMEHLAEPIAFLREARRVAPRLLLSVPNELGMPFGRRGYAFHHRHYTPDQLGWHLARAGFEPSLCGWQADAVSPVMEEWTSTESYPRTLVVDAKRVAPALNLGPEPATPERAPRHVVILGLGPSLETFVDLVKRMGGASALCDEVWGINAVGDVIACDKIFHLDDVRIQQARAEASPTSNIAAMLRWMKRHPGPIYTSRTHPDFPGLVEYPLQDVLNSIGFAYLNSTAAYAVAYAIHIGVQEIGLFGLDFSYANSHQAEKGRGCVEFLLGIAHARGIRIGFPETTTLMDACAPNDERLYGYDTVHVDLAGGGDEPITVALRERETIATAAEIEARYDHARPTVPAEMLAKAAG